MELRYKKYILNHVLLLKDWMGTYYVQDRFCDRQTMFDVQLKTFCGPDRVVKWLASCQAFDHLTIAALRRFLAEKAPRNYQVHRMDNHQVMDEAAAVIVNYSYTVVYKPIFDPPNYATQTFNILAEVRDGASLSIIAQSNSLTKAHRLMEKAFATHKRADHAGQPKGAARIPGHLVPWMQKYRNLMATRQDELLPFTGSWQDPDTLKKVILNAIRIVAVASPELITDHPGHAIDTLISAPINEFVALLDGTWPSPDPMQWLLAAHINTWAARRSDRLMGLGEEVLPEQPPRQIQKTTVPSPPEKYWLKIKARYDDPWKTPMPFPDVKVTVDGAVVEEGIVFTPGVENNTRARSLAEALRTKDEPAVHVIENMPNGAVVVEFVRQTGLEKEIADAREALLITLDGAYRDTVEQMREFQEQWDKYGRLSMAINLAEGAYGGASAWIKDQAELAEWETWRQMGLCIADNAGKLFDYAADYTIETYDKLLQSANETIDWVGDNQENLMSWSWLSDVLEETYEETVDNTKQQYDDAVDFLAQTREQIEKANKHKEAILQLPTLIAEGDAARIEHFIDTVLMDIDPEIAKAIKEDPNYYIVLELIADHDSALTYFAYLSLFIEAVPPNFYVYLAGKGGGYAALEIILMAALAFLSAGAGTAARATALLARLTAIGTKAAKAGKKIKQAKAAINAFTRTVEDFLGAIDTLKKLGQKLNKARNGGKFRKGATNSTIAHKKEKTKRNTRCRICKQAGHTTQRSRKRGCVVYK